MANIILAEHYTAAAMTITLASLASSTAGVGRQSTLIDNTDLYQIIHVFVKVTTGTSPTASRNIYVYLIKGDGTHRSDGAGATDAAITRVNARLLGSMFTSNVSDTAYYGEFVIRNPGSEWGIAIVHDTGVNLNATAGNHHVRYVGENVEVQ